MGLVPPKSPKFVIFGINVPLIDESLKAIFTKFGVWEVPATILVLCVAVLSRGFSVVAELLDTESHEILSQQTCTV